MPLNQQAQKSGCGFAVPATLSPPSLQLQNTKHTSAANAIQKSTATIGAATPGKEGFLNLPRIFRLIGTSKIRDQTAKNAILQLSVASAHSQLLEFILKYAIAGRLATHSMQIG